MLKVGFLPLYKIEGPSSRYRVFQFMAPLSRLGFRCLHLEAPERNSWERIGYVPRLFNLALKSDVLFIQKRVFPTWVLLPLRLLNPNIVFDLDDAIYLQRGNKRKVNRMLRAAKLVIAGNDYLAEYARVHNPDVRVIPSVVDVNLYTPPISSRHPHNKQVVIGWIGTDPNRGDLEPMRAIFDQLGKRFGERIALNIVARCPLQMETGMKVNFMRWTLEDSRKALQGFDIGIMPLADTAWNRGKCGVKLIQYMAVGAAAVASPVGVNQDIVRDGDSGFLAVTQEEWVGLLTRLIEDEALRQRMGAQGRLRVERDFSIETVLPRIVEALETAAMHKGKRT